MKLLKRNRRPYALTDRERAILAQMDELSRSGQREDAYELGRREGITDGAFDAADAEMAAELAELEAQLEIEKAQEKAARTTAKAVTAPRATAPVVTPARQQVQLPAGYDDAAGRPKLITALARHGLAGWQIESIDTGAAVLVAPGRHPALRPRDVTWTLGVGTKPTDAARIDALARKQGLNLVDWRPFEMTAVVAALPASTSRLRDRIAEHLRCDPWGLELVVEWTVGKQSGTGEITTITVHRSPAIASSEKRRETWLELAKTLVPAPVGTMWWVEDLSAEGRLVLRRAEDPLGELQHYPWDAPVDYKHIPFATDAAGNPVTLGLLEVNQLMGGVPGGGKSGGITALLCGISRLENVALIGLDPKMVELNDWEPRFSRIATQEDDALAVLELLTEEMQRRYEWLAKSHMKKFAPKDFSPERPMLVLVIDELADLVSVGVLKEEKDADAQRSTRIRRLIAKGRAAGLVVLAATQKPQSDVVPTALRDLIQLRVAYATTNAAMTETILGAGMAQTGGLSHEIPATLRGVCYIVNETSRTPVRARTYWVPDEEVQGIGERTAHLRIDLPWLGGGRANPTESTITSETFDLGTMTFDLTGLDEDEEEQAADDGLDWSKT